jgi:hypothetical protein
VAVALQRVGVLGNARSVGLDLLAVGIDGLLYLQKDCLSDSDSAIFSARQRTALRCLAFSLISLALVCISVSSVPAQKKTTKLPPTDLQQLSVLLELLVVGLQQLGVLVQLQRDTSEREERPEFSKTSAPLPPPQPRVAHGKRASVFTRPQTCSCRVAAKEEKKPKRAKQHFRCVGTASH